MLIVIAGLVAVGLMVLFLQATNRSTPPPDYSALAAPTRPYDPDAGLTAARGILLRVDVFSTRGQRRGLRVEFRQMVIDVEVPGQAPFQLSGVASFSPPLVRDMLPGTAVELRLEGRNNVHVVGLASGFVAVATAAPAPTARAGRSA